VAGGASVIDVKEPDAGPLGRAPESVWRDVRRAVPSHAPVSVALGELSEWRPGPTLPPEAVDGVSFCKLGLAHAGPGWRDEWRALRERLSTGDCRWIAVVYADWRTAGAPEPDDILAEAITEPAVVGILVDTFDKSRPARYDARWLARARRVKDAGRMLAMAGGLTAGMIRDLAAFEPDLIAVRGAACEGGDRKGAVDERRVSELAEMVRALSARL
jgi:uncharacterized protein (UPF0264 family)